MSNKFTLILVGTTFFSGIIWLLQKCKLIKCLYYPYLRQGTIISIYKFIDYYSSLFPMLFLVFIIRSFIFEPFQIPSGSMMPTLLIGDYILVEKFSYGLKNPLNNKTLVFARRPQRGDIVVFQYPKNPNINYIKRIIGLPGDLITYNPTEKKLMIKSNFIDPQKYKRINIDYSPLKISDFVQTFNIAKGIVTTCFDQISQNDFLGNSLRMWERLETLDNITHKIFILPQEPTVQTNVFYKQPNHPPATWLVPKGYYFMMGDNRDNSADSRYWGFVAEHHIVGKAIFIWMSINKKNCHWVPSGIRVNRIGIIK
ncbi:MAG: signal peptidase I [Candidatus Dasytiphilus stammeri]